LDENIFTGSNYLIVLLVRVRHKAVIGHIG